MKTKVKLFGSIMAVIIFTATLILCLMFTPSVQSAYADEIQSEEELTEPYEILSYKDVFEAYYDRALEEVMTSGGIMCSLDDFTDNYYTYDTNIYEYTEAVIDNGGQSDDLSIMPMSSLDSTDAPYILKYSTDSAENRTIYKNFAERGYDDTETPKSAFKIIDESTGKRYEPSYSIFSYYLLKEGDILIETLTILNIGHTACVYDLDHESAYGQYIQTIDCVGGGVQFGILDDTRMIDYQIIIMRNGYANNGQIEAVKYFHYKQLGKEYNVSAAVLYNRLNTDINSIDWYCSELMYAAFYYAGIPLIPPEHKVDDNKIGWWPADIRNSRSLTKCIDIYDAYLRLSIAGKVSNVWKINITNRMNSNAVIYYNTKMCFYGDAEKWVGLKDVAQINIWKNVTVRVNIQKIGLRHALRLALYSAIND